MALFVPEEDIFPSDAIAEQVLLDSIEDNIAEAAGELLPTNYESLFQAMEDFDSRG